MILWLLFLSLLSISTATPSCCADDDYWSCDEDVTCSCSNFKDACYFTNGPESDPGTCYIYATCGCCIVGNNQQYDNFCKDCSCKNFTGAAYTTSMDGYCYVYEPPDEVGCCNNLWEFEFGSNPFINYTCKAAPGLCKINTEDGCWVMGPCSYEGCCLVEDSIFDSPTSSCSNFSGSTNFTIEDSDDFVCWVFAPSIDVVGGCGCVNATGNCTCESSSLSCNLTFFDGTWGNIPPGSGVVYRYFPDGLDDPVTELYYCPLSYDPPAIAITIVCLVVSGALTLCYLARKTDPEFFQATNIWKKFYRLGTILNMFWPAVHMSITLGYLYWLMSSQTFAPIQVYTSKSDSSDKTDNTDQTDNSDQTPYYMLVNANWYAQYNGTYSMPLNTTTVNGQECYISTETEPNSSLGYPAIILFLIVSLVHTFHTMYRPENKKMNYFLYCLSTAVNLFTVPWTWYAWDYCYSLLPSYSGSLGSIYKYLYIVDCGCAGIIFLAWMAVLFLGLNGGCAFVTTMLAICVMALVGFFYKIMTYLQLALRFYPKLVIVFDLVFHIHFVASAFIPYFKSKLKL